MTTEQKIFLGQCFNNATHLVAALHGRESTELESNAMIAKMVKELTKALNNEMIDLFLPEDDLQE